MFLFPDTATAISVDLLKSLDGEKPGRWYAQPKLDGWFRCAVKTGDKWTWRARPGGTGERKHMPPDLQAEFERLPWPEGIGLCMEWIGPRGVLKRCTDFLYVFDVFMIDGELCDWPAWKRRNLIDSWRGLSSNWNIPNIRFAESFQNPGLLDRFQEQLSNPLSEGLVLRRADQVLAGHPSQCRPAPLILKCKYRSVRNAIGGGQ